MKDRVGIYYYPYPENKKTRMYVRLKNGDIEFRIRNDNDLKVWTEHGWVSSEAIAQAKILYSSTSGFDPNQTYDFQLAKTLIKEES